jgi:hypothetical protein
MAAARQYEFHGFRVDLQQRQLWDPHGQPVDLPARAFDTLVYLPAGRSFVDLVFRAAEKGAYDPSGLNDYVYEAVTNREIVVLEFTR